MPFTCPFSRSLSVSPAALCFLSDSAYTTLESTHTNETCILNVQEAFVAPAATAAITCEYGPRPARSPARTSRMCCSCLIRICHTHVSVHPRRWSYSQVRHRSRVFLQSASDLLGRHSQSGGGVTTFVHSRMRSSPPSPSVGTSSLSPYASSPMTLGYTMVSAICDYMRGYMRLHCI